MSVTIALSEFWSDVQSGEWLLFGVAVVAAVVAIVSACAAWRSAGAARISAALYIPRVRITTPPELTQLASGNWTAFRVENLSAAEATINLRRWYKVRDPDAAPFSKQRYWRRIETDRDKLFQEHVRIPNHSGQKWERTDRHKKVVLGPFDHVDFQVNGLSGLIDISLGGIADAAYDTVSGDNFCTSIKEAIHLAKTGERPEREWRLADEEK